MLKNLLSSQFRLEKLMGKRKAVKRGEVIFSLKPCAFYRGYPYMKKESGHCKLGNRQARCSGDFTLCENLETLKKYFRETGLGWHRWGKGNGTD